MMKDTSRRSFLKHTVAGAGLTGLGRMAAAAEKPIQGLRRHGTRPRSGTRSGSRYRIARSAWGLWALVSANSGPRSGFRITPNVEVVAVSDLIPERCAGLAKACRCEKTYPSLEELVKDDAIEAVFVATDAPSHARHCIDVLKHGKHVATAVPATFGSLEEADQVFAAVKASGLNYMMFETSTFHNDCYAMRQIFNAGEFGTMVYTEGEYYHYMATPIDSFKGWRVGLPPQWYPTHSNAYYAGVTGGSFTEVSCMGIPSVIPPSPAREQPLPEPLRIGDCSVPHQRGRHVANGGQLGHARPRR